MLRQESDTERSCTDTCHITPKNTLPGRRSTGRKGWSRGLAKWFQTRAIFSRSPFQTLHRVSLNRHPNSPESFTMMILGRCPSTSRIHTLRNQCLLRIFYSPYRLKYGRAMVPPTLCKTFRQRRNRSPLQPPRTLQSIITLTYTALKIQRNLLYKNLENHLQGIMVRHPITGTGCGTGSHSNRMDFYHAISLSTFCFLRFFIVTYIPFARIHPSLYLTPSFFEWKSYHQRRLLLRSDATEVFDR